MTETNPTAPTVYRPLSISQAEEAPLRSEAARHGVQVLDSGSSSSEPESAKFLTLIGDEAAVRAVNQFVKQRRGSGQ
ncbi:hypothetical protein [Kineosporia babensis]|uniref:Uncharacterized protein n=1 Tax=Kineosporia babensis TaxID=499548 RepID=A0A9X1NBJ8_9ACTN|nr:hypothetical protein [Kineosporia babensis]MCD5310756.1 hypothetical protein [Kineosporia babensis]